MKILITGVHGFVGSNLVVDLKGEHEIYGLDIMSYNKEGVIRTFSWDNLKDFPVVECGKSNIENNLPAIDAVIHLAGKTHDTKSQSVAEAYFTINAGLTQTIFDWFLKSGAKKFIFFSSVKAADFVQGDVLKEEVVPAPVESYGESKIKAEEYILSKKVPSDKSVYILRPCMIHGPGNMGNLNLLYCVVKKGIPWSLGAFENKRSFTSIDNLCYVINGLLTKNISSGIYHIGDDEALSTNELIEVMCKAIGKKAYIWKINRSFMKSIARIGDLFHLPLNSVRLKKLTENYVVSNVKIKMALEIEKMPISAYEGLTKTIKSFEK